MIESMGTYDLKASWESVEDRPTVFGILLPNPGLFSCIQRALKDRYCCPSPSCYQPGQPLEWWNLMYWRVIL